jgi:transcriptional regulator with XRE-family HTH domain
LTLKRQGKYTSLMGTRIRRARTARGMTQATLAARACITRKYVVDLEAGRYDPTVGVLRRIARSLRVPITALLP